MSKRSIRKRRHRPRRATIPKWLATYIEEYARTHMRDGMSADDYVFLPGDGKSDPRAR